MSYSIGADLGTSALKLLLVREDGKIHRTVSRTYPCAYPKPTWSEQAPADWWDAFVSGTKELLDGIHSAEITGIGIGGQMHGLVVLDHDDQVIRPAILWNDARTDGETDYLNTVVGKDTLSACTANIAFAGFTAPKLLWMRNQEPDLFQRIQKIMLPKDYLTYRLTGVHATDYSDASGMLLLDVAHKCWSEQMLNICGITQAQMPKLFESYEVVGKLLPSVADALGLPHTVQVVAGAGDNAAAAIGTGTVGNGKCNISMGTSGTIFVSSDSFSIDHMNALHSFCHADGGYHLMGCILSAASCNKWFCEEILQSDDYTALQQGIEPRLNEANNLFFLPYLMGERSPINDTDARGTFIGLTMSTTREDMIRSVLEGVAYAIRDNLEIVRSQGIEISSATLCGGGAKSPLWQKILCNILNIPIHLPVTEQGPGYGAAMLAMVGCSAYSSVEECAMQFTAYKQTLTPDPALSAMYEVQYNKFREIYPIIKPLFKKLK